MSCMYGSREALSRSKSVLAQVRDWKVRGLQGIACLIMLAGRAGTNLSSNFLTYWDCDRVTVKSLCCVISTPKNQERGPTCLALKPLGPVNSLVNHSRCLVPLCATMMSSTYTPTTNTLSFTLLVNRQGSCVELVKPILSTRCFLSLSCHMRDACLVP